MKWINFFDFLLYRIFKPIEIFIETVRKNPVLYDKNYTGTNNLMYLKYKCKIKTKPRKNQSCSLNLNKKSMFLKSTIS